MNFNIEDFIKACGYENFNNSTSSNNRSETSDGNNINNETNEFFNMGCNDIPGGFQSVNPQLFTIVGEILGDIIAGNLPFNVQNAVGNWLQLVGQVILTYNAQQQYFQGGPGRYFNPKYFNVSNPFCSNTSAGSTEGNTSSGTFTYSDNINQSNTSNKGNFPRSKEGYKDKSNIKNDNDYIKELKEDINMLMEQIDEIKNRINDIENF